MRERLYEIIEVGSDDDKLSMAYDVGMMITIFVSIIPLAFINTYPIFNNYFDAVYWATVSLTTVGYGDIYPVTTAGRIITMISSFAGIAVVALPAGVITSGFIDELRNPDNENRKE